MLATWGCTTFPKPTLSLDFLGATSLDSGITFSRGSQATLFDSTGTLRYAKHNLSTNSASTSAFGTPTNATLTSTAISTPLPGVTTAGLLVLNVGANTGNSTDGVALVNLINLPTQTQVTFSAFVKAAGTTVFRLRSNVTGSVFSFTLLGTGTAPTPSSDLQAATISALSDGWYRVTWTFTTTTGAPSARADYWTWKTDTANGTAGVYITGTQVNIANMEGGVTSSLTTYYPTTTAAYYAPRFDYNPSTLQPRGLLIEEQRTNSIRNNTGVGAVVGSPGTDPTNWVVSPSAVGLTKEIIAIGTENGIAYVDIRYSGTPSSGSNVSISFEGTNNVVASSGQTWTESVYVKLQAGAFTNTSTTLSLIGTNGTSGTEGFSSAAITSTPSDLRNCRLSVTGTLANAGTTHIQPRVRIGYTAGVAFDITLRIGLPQLELGAFATSVIPTTTTALTRNADVASMTGTNFSSWYNQSEGTVFGQFLRTAPANSVQGRVFSLSDGSNNAVIEIYQTGVSNPAAQIGNSGLQAQWTPTGFTVGLPIKEILAYKLNDSIPSFNGSAETLDTVCTIPTVNQAQIGNRWDNIRNLNGYVQRLAYYPTRLPNATLQALTA